MRRCLLLLLLACTESALVGPALRQRLASPALQPLRTASPLLLAPQKPSLESPSETASTASALTADADSGLAKAEISDASASDVMTEEDPEDTGVWRLVVLALTVIWASNFAVIKLIFQNCPEFHPSEYAALRFAIAALALLPALFRTTSNAARAGGLEIGGWISLGYFGQAIGLMTTTANKSAFICSLHVIWVAAVNSVIRSSVERKAVAAALLAVAGVGCLELSGSSAPVIGDVWSLAQPIGFGTGYIRLEQLMSRFPEEAAAISAAKVLVVGLFAMTWAAADAGGVPQLHLDVVLNSPLLIGCFLWTGVVTTALSIAVESFAFRFVPAQDAAIILSSEPLWAAALAYAALGEEFGLNDALGGALVISACVLNEIPQKRLPAFLRNEEGPGEGGGAEGGAEASHASSKSE